MVLNPGFWPLLQLHASRTSLPMAQQLLAEDSASSSPSSGCSGLHPSSSCTWICRLGGGGELGSADWSRTNGTESAKRKLASSSCSGQAGRGPYKRRHYEFIPGSFALREVISDSEDGDEVTTLLPRTKGRGTRDRPFCLDLEHARDDDSPKLGDALLPPLPGCESPTAESHVTTSFTEGVTGEQSGLEIGAARKDAEPNDDTTGSLDLPHPGANSLPTGQTNGADSRLLTRRDCPNSTWPCEKRKNHLFNPPSPAIQAKINRYVTAMHSTLDPHRLPQACWLCPDPPGGGARAITRCIRWRDGDTLHRVYINYGILSLMHHALLTDAQRHGFINCAWHLSHLCGNWTCVNPAHFTVEPGSVNVRRNKCFRDRNGPCGHVPGCLKELKRIDFGGGIGGVGEVDIGIGIGIGGVGCCFGGVWC